MYAILNFVEFIIQSLLSLVVWAVIAYAILSWLIAFNVVNVRNRAVWQISNFLERVVRPLLRPFQRFLPTMGGMDFSPIWTGGRYWSWSLIQMRLVGSSER